MRSFQVVVKMVDKNGKMMVEQVGGLEKHQNFISILWIIDQNFLTSMKSAMTLSMMTFNIIILCISDLISTLTILSLFVAF